MIDPTKLRPERKGSSGLSLVEVTIMMVLFLAGSLGFSRALKDSIDLGKTNHESALAREAAQQVLETMRGVPFDEVFARYNSDPDDDPGGVDTADGTGFAVNGLNPLASDVDGFVGEVVMPELNAAGVCELREDLEDASFGMPRDLNLDGLLDAANHSADYRIMPVLVRMQWRGPTGPRKFSVHTIISDR